VAQCTAKSKRSKEQCQRWAVRGRRTCHLHGGKSKGPKTKKGKERSRLAAMKHGGYTKKALAEDQEARNLIRLSRDTLCFLAF
jgi:hypothetical protein